MSLPPGLINLDHYTAAAQAMSEMDEHKAQMDASRQVSQKVNMLGHGGALRNKIASFAGVRDDVRASSVPKRKRRDAHDIRRDYVQSFVPDYGHNLGQTYFPFGDGMTLIFHGSHKLTFMLDNSDKNICDTGMTPTLNILLQDMFLKIQSTNLN